ncbi:BlaI/MecI/CopY family transcriptional regulator [Fulvivirgaceae bacterium BMA10]|uniref:BlaI/MecI/CopY family transcriptional regulator n=1 Tax=Splendidivirga corallicola TaxID=3051826 RepID=A0ABT8KU60_9BACT|nr:BlaI/MecI/CopY family transcriptional regulator [Fulvivirgaceae bacterium BMA10]
MKINRTNKPTDSELEILQVLWENGPSTVRFINDTLSTQRNVGYTTTLKLMQIMHDKGLLTRQKEGKTHIYKPAVPKEETQGQLIDKLLNTAFEGSAMKLVMQTLGNRRSTAEELQKIRDFIDNLEGGQDE